ncbi:MAG: Tad domain-containing protein, partial [Chloroflexi bacterium]|nr:Tad domain-containing protein [Chloroflexota bacterium]
MGSRALLRAMHADEAGQSVVIVALSFTLLLGFAGLAIDGGRYYAERRFLQSAVDAAALGCVQKLTVGGTQQQAEDQGELILRTYNLPGDPTGTGVVVNDDPQYDTWFNASGSADKRNLYDGVYAGSTDCRVAVRASMQTLFIRLFGLQAISVPANAHAVAKGGMYPVIVNRYKDPPGPSSTFVDHIKQDAYQSANPNTCSENGGGGCPDAAAEVYSVDGSGVVTCSVCLWGPETVIAGQGYQSSDSDFRGFIALDVRDFSTSPTGASLFYNGVTAGTQTNTLKDIEASYVNGGYPGPDLETYVVVVSNFDRYFQVGDKVLIQLFDGQVREIPEYTINAPSSIGIPSTTYGPADGTTFRVGANQRFRDAGDKVVLEMVRDTFNGTETDTPTQLADMHFDPGSEPSPPYVGRFTPAGGSGTQVRIRDLQLTGGSAGIYSVIIKGQGYEIDGTQLSTKKAYVPLNVGGVTGDFAMSFDATAAEFPLNGTATFTFSLSTGSAGGAFGNSNVTFALDSTGCTIGYVALVSAIPSEPLVCATATISP